MFKFVHFFNDFLQLFLILSDYNLSFVSFPFFIVEENQKVIVLRLYALL
jgi:hypothetical protein